MRIRLFGLAAGLSSSIASALAVAAVLSVSTVSGAQKGGGGLTGGGTGGDLSGAPTARALTPFEEFAGKLKLDEKTQQPAAAEILNGAAQESGAVGVQLLQIRQKMLNAELSGNADAVKAATDEYIAAGSKMAMIEANAFAKVYALLKPNQQNNAPKAFAELAGFFQSPGAARGGRGGRQ